LGRNSFFIQAQGGNIKMATQAASNLVVESASRFLNPRKAIAAQDALLRMLNSKVTTHGICDASGNRIRSMADLIREQNIKDTVEKMVASKIPEHEATAIPTHPRSMADLIREREGREIAARMTATKLPRPEACAAELPG
jgi:hypothetical protein